jgi:hypothetical protein
MKRSELKESIKSEIKSVLSENRYDINDPNSPMGKLSDEYESSGLKGIVDNYGLDVVLMVLSSGEYGDRLNESVLSEESRFPTQADIDDIENSGNIDIAYDKAMKLLKSLMNKSVSFADIREEEMTDAEKKKAAEKGAKKEKLGKQASKLSKEDEDRYDRIKNGLEKLKKKGDEESIKRMKAILAKKDVQKLIKAKGREESSFM